MTKLEYLERIADLFEGELRRCRNAGNAALAQTEIDAAEVHYYRAMIDVLDWKESWAYRLGLRE